MVTDFLAAGQQENIEEETIQVKQHSHYRQYQSNKKELQNLGIERMLANDKDNEEL